MLVFLIAMIWVAPIGVLIHELGHALPTVLLTKGNAELHLGTGPKMKVMKLGKLNLQLYAIFFLGGRTESRHKYNICHWQEAIISLGGPFFNLFVFLFLYLTSFTDQGGPLHIFMLFNLYLACFNLIPFRWKEKSSDGYRIFQVLSNYK